MEIDWEIVGTIALWFQFITSGLALFGALLSEEFWLELRKDKLQLLVLLFAIIPIGSQAILVILFIERIKIIKDTLKPDTDDVVPLKLQQLVKMVITNKDYIIQNDKLYNKALNLRMSKGRISIDERTYLTKIFNKDVEKILHENLFSDIFELYESTKKVSRV